MISRIASVLGGAVLLAYVYGLNQMSEYERVPDHSLVGGFLFIVGVILIYGGIRWRGK